MGTRSDWIELLFSQIGEDDPFSDPFSSAEGIASDRKRSFGWSSLTDASGDELPFSIFESVTPAVSDPIAEKTDVGD